MLERSLEYSGGSNGRLTDSEDVSRSPAVSPNFTVHFRVCWCVGTSAITAGVDVERRRGLIGSGESLAWQYDGGGGGGYMAMNEGGQGLATSKERSVSVGLKKSVGKAHGGRREGPGDGLGVEVVVEEGRRHTATERGAGTRWGGEGKMDVGRQEG